MDTTQDHPTGCGLAQSVAQGILQDGREGAPPSLYTRVWPRDDATLTSMWFSGTGLMSEIASKWRTSSAVPPRQISPMLNAILDMRGCLLLLGLDTCGFRLQHNDMFIFYKRKSSAVFGLLFLCLGVWHMYPSPRRGA
jgi:hypothetical protein